MNKSSLSIRAVRAKSSGAKVLSFYGGNKPLKKYFKNRNYCLTFVASYQNSQAMPIDSRHRFDIVRTSPTLCSARARNGCSSAMEIKTAFYFTLLSPFTIFAPFSINHRHCGGISRKLSHTYECP